MFVMLFGFLNCVNLGIRQLLPQLKGPLPSIIALQNPPSDIEALLLRSIEWTTFMDTTYDTALEQATVILRYFLGKTSALNLNLSLIRTKVLDASPWRVVCWICYRANLLRLMNLKNVRRSISTIDNSSMCGGFSSELWSVNRWKPPW